MNVLHGFGDDHQAVGENFLLHFMRRIRLRCGGHGVIYSGMARAKMPRGEAKNVSTSSANEKFGKRVTSTFRLGKACHIRWNNAAERQSRLLYRWNTLRRRNM